MATSGSSLIISNSNLISNNANSFAGVIFGINGALKLILITVSLAQIQLALLEEG